MSLGVCYKGKRKVIQCTPSTKLSDVLEQSAQFFGVDPRKSKLINGRKKLDSSLTYRYSNLPMGSSINLEVEEENLMRANSSQIATTKVVSTLQDGNLISKVFPASFSLDNIIQSYMAEGLIILHESNILEILFMQSIFSGDDLRSTTLSSLGVGGQVARFRIIGCNSANSEMVENNKQSELMNEMSKKADNTNQVDMEVCKTADSNSLQMDSNHKNIDHFVLLKAILENNFDAVAKPALILLSKYVFNIAANPIEQKYRIIYMDNPAFVEKIDTCKGAIEFLQGCGFVQVENMGRRAFSLHNTPGAKSSECDETGEGFFLDVVNSLVGAMNELQIPIDEQPKFSKTAKAKTSDNITKQTDFDPFKTFVRRVSDVTEDGTLRASMVRNSGKAVKISNTEEKLLQIESKRREIEGIPCKLDENSCMNGSEYLISDNIPQNLLDPSASSFNDSNKESSEGEAMFSDKNVLAMSIKGMLCDEDAPLTTAAVRALKKANSEKVYNGTLVRVKLPDRSILQRIFHPRHALSDIYMWVNACLSTDLRQDWNEFQNQLKCASEKKGSKNRFPLFPFELYVTPPRQVIPNNNDVLLDQKLVPSALLFLSWEPYKSIIAAMNLRDYVDKTTSVFIRDDLLKSAKRNQEGNLVVPYGTPLIDTLSKNIISGKKLQEESQTTKIDGKSTGKKTPSWMKL